MKKYFALLLIIIMAISVVSAAGVVTPKKAAAKPTGAPSQSPKPIYVQYMPGATYTFTPS